eukprot:TRINITY_DN4220_c0_g1_i2.p2 TRINITY_DN4220_c0_g1~~TRINITY_DN4220_c0_g1_i2.p2  ORF type:complete len:235 (-),score=6.34 TRINITY_DN4220_c0_g1_i2:227-931(-)
MALSTLTAASTMGDFLLKYRDIFHTTKSSSIKSIEKQPGFSYLKLEGSKVFMSGIDQTEFLKISQDTLPSMLGLPLDAQKKFAEHMKLFMLGNEMNYYIVDFLFASGKGSGYMLSFIAMKSGKEVNFAYGKMLTKFTLAPTMVITRVVKSNFFSHKEYEEISCIPSNITLDDIKALFGRMLDQLALGDQFVNMGLLINAGWISTCMWNQDGYQDLHQYLRYRGCFYKAFSCGIK